MKKTKTLPGAFVIAGTSSGSGKTVLTIGLMEALKRRGIAVQPFKAGPDYIDPGHHRALLKRPSYNLDAWIMGAEGVRKTFLGNIGGADMGVIEGAMGLFDGKDGVSEDGSTAQLSKILKLPVLLVVNAEKAGRTIGAVVKGFEAFDPGVRIRWVVFNRVGSVRHYSILKDAVSANSKAEVIGYIPRDEGLVMPERHLGLITSEDLGSSRRASFVRKAYSLVERHIDIGRLLGAIPGVARHETVAAPICRPSVRIAVALDSAFSFYYEENLEILRGAGARLVFFSPIKDRRLPRRVNGVYLGGGYPELYAEALEANGAIRDEIRQEARKGLPIYAECGGLMYLGKAVRDSRGRSFSMAGVFPWSTEMNPKRRALGYREVYTLPGSPIRCVGTVKGHEYHYSGIVDGPGNASRVFGLKNGGVKNGSQGHYYKNTVASYIHLHFASNPAFATEFVRICKGHKEGG